MQRRAPRLLGLLAFTALLLLCGCSSTRPWLNAPLQQGSAAPVSPIAADRDPSILVAVTLSGGGARAAAFGYGVLSELQRTRFRWNGVEQDLLLTAPTSSAASRAAASWRPTTPLSAVPGSRTSSATFCGRTSRTA